jgi:transcriptional regulator with XRE-family HTH domain
MRRDWAKLFGRQLAKLRKTQKLKQHELEEKIGSGPQYISHLETGRSKPSFDNIFQLAEALDVPPMELFFEAGLDEKKDIIRKRIENLLDRCDEKELRRVYRLILVSLEKP